MPIRYVVHLTRTNPQIDGLYPPDYFPRGFHYKGDAIDLVTHIVSLGGEAEIKKPAPVNQKQKQEQEREASVENQIADLTRELAWARDVLKFLRNTCHKECRCNSVVNPCPFCRINQVMPLS